ncbi:hypothetical protein C0992_004422 [Termitomyces sp. T32_za158]|nr:hypothetical protein C0992_004422 [Termitomyces sp. T32_za158]
MAEAEREAMEREVLGEPFEVDCLIEYGMNSDGTRVEVDGWLMPVLELQRIKKLREDLACEDQGYYSNDGRPITPIPSSELSRHIVNVHGILMLRAPGRGLYDPTSPLISTPTTVQALRSLALHVSIRLPTLLTSPPSSGKLLFLSHLAELLYPGVSNKIVTIHLADTSLDPRALLGSYVSSLTQPGTFEWKEGVLVRSLREGKWVVFKDIDRGSNEVLGVIKPLVESLREGKWIGGRASLHVPSRGRVVAADSFALFATRSTAPSRTGIFSAPTFFGAHKFYEIVTSSPTAKELCMILDSRFPRLAGHPNLAIIRLWEAIKSLSPAASVRDIGLRELEKLCARVQRLLPSSYQSMDVDMEDSTPALSFSSIFPNPTLREDIYIEARDVFFGAGITTASARAHTESISQITADYLGLDPERRLWVMNGRTPEFEVERDVDGTVTAVRVGRTHLTAHPTKLRIAAAPSRPFAMHKPAVVLLSRIATAVALLEPVLLTGETGTGKTSVVTHLASLLRRPLISLNLSHQTESSDLLGGFKPVDARIPGAQLQQKFLDLFGGTFSRRKNEKFEVEVRKAVAEGKWKRAVGLWKESARLARERIQTKEVSATVDGMEKEGPRKRRRVEQHALNVSAKMWAAFIQDVEQFEVQHVHGKGKFAFGFVEGPLVKALRNGDWVLLDEINLASPETLECISGLLHGPTASITLTEQGSLEPVPRHLDFRLFACMNPATDVGKKDLPPNIRSRFTEIDVPPPDADKETLLSIVNQYIGASAVGDKGAIMNVAEFYAAVKDLAERRQIADGSNHRPHFSMRTLARALTFASDTASMFGLRRAIWEGCLMAFTMVLDIPSAELVTALAQKHLLAGVRNPRSMLMKVPSVPSSRSADEYIQLGPFYLERGSLPEDPAEDYIITPSVEAKLIDLARIILTRRFPILIEGPTSAGKTSSVEYLAKRTGHRFIRINNHEHTDIQEYIGSYVSDPQTGKLVFKDGLLVRALRNGDWIVLDELNLAPTDVLEALNRLLDDNRELVIPETQEVVKPHPHFMLFATQNPPGLYAGRKVLSRAFRNRFLEVHFADVPQAELETILCQRCRIAPSYGKRIVTVFHELQKRRQSSRVFESKQGFATLRDLFRWAGRDAVGYQELAENGYMLLAERARRDEDKAAVKEVIETVMHVKIDENKMYDLNRPDFDISSFLGCSIPAVPDLIWTTAMRRLFVLVSRALRFNEPVLLVGETGAGKTSVCQVFATATSQRLHGLNCHQNTETADLIGGLRPLRNRTPREAEIFKEALDVFREIGITQLPQSLSDLSVTLPDILKLNSLPPNARVRVRTLQTKLLQLESIFEWHDGPLVEAMRCGDVFLLDEISLADDSVLERLNSVLEPGRTIVLAEKGGEDELAHPALKADKDFKLVATMNPGGDYGKKELSPALRNRFTEIWVPRVEDRHDLELIVGNIWKHETLKQYTSRLLDFVDWLCTRVGDNSLTSLRDILAWVTFSNAIFQSDSSGCMPGNEIFHHAAHMTFLDGLASLPQLSTYTRKDLRQLKDDAISQLMDLVPLPDRDNLFTYIPPYDPSLFVQFGSFSISKGPQQVVDSCFNLEAPTTQDNAMRVVRACQVLKPILLEGSPGVGKTSLITALANVSGHHLCRINLSDQTDIIDLFGSDLPAEGGGPGEFAWKDAEFLKALQEGHWVLLDEMNLAPQAVLEGLNAVLDHRGAVYIPELGRSFVRHPNFRIFAAQNPLHQGGGRKGLPKSFVNRFTKVFVEELSPSDMLLVCSHLFPEIGENVLRNMITYNMQLQEAVGVERNFAREGAPWEFNLRDVIRWASLLCTPHSILHPFEHLHTIYLHRFRTEQDRLQARLLFDQVFTTAARPFGVTPNLTISSRYLQVGYFTCVRQNMAPPSPSPPGRILKMQLFALETIGLCVSHSWLAILTGHRNSGKTEVVRVLSHFTGNVLQEIYVNSSTDTMDILGSFEQVDLRGRALSLVDELLSYFDHQVRSTSGSKLDQNKVHMLRRARQTSASHHDLLRLASECLAAPSDMSEVASALLGKVHTLLTTSEAVGRFEWVDGPLVQAMKRGHWLLLDGANLCNPSVLDRLNSLCENNGVLTLSERGYVDGKVEILKPHPNFRLFMTVDPQFGELSRAMRNRGIEISMISSLIADDGGILSDYHRLPYNITTPRNLKPWSIAFEKTRRGLSTTLLSQVPSLATTGHSLDLDCNLSSLTDHGPMISVSSLTESTDALLFFVARTTAPSSVLPFYRLLTMLQDTRREPINRIQGVLRTFTDGTLVGGTLPLDFYLNALPCVDKKLGSNDFSPHNILFGVIDLAVTMFLDAEDEAGTSGIKSTVLKQGKKYQTSKQIQGLLEAIQIVARKTLDSLTITSEVPQIYKSLRLASSLLDYGRYLRKIAAAAVLDFSALQAACCWIADALEDSPSVFSTAVLCAHELKDAISLSTGLGLQDIWSALFIDRSYVSSTSLELVEKHSAYLEGKEAQNIRRQVFDFMALRTLPVSVSTHSNEKLETLRADLESHLLRQKAEVESEFGVDPSLLIAELGVLLMISDAEGLKERVADLIDIACCLKGGLLRLTSYQHLSWTLEANKHALPLLAETQMQWLDSLWNISTLLNKQSVGPTILLQPTQLIATIATCDWSQKSLRSVESYRMETRHHSRLLFLQSERSTRRIDELAGILSQSMNLVIECFLSSFPVNTHPALLHPNIRSVADFMSYSNTIMTHTEESSNRSFKRAVALHLYPAFGRLKPRCAREKIVDNMGRCWIALGSLILDLFVPDVSVDPVAIQNCSTERRRREQGLIEMQVKLHRTLEQHTTGNDHNDILDYLVRMSNGISQQLEAAPFLPLRKDVARLDMFWAEVRQFHNQVLSNSKIQEMIGLLVSSDKNAIAREEVLQQSMAGFYHRLATVYTDYSDLSAPLRLAILYIRMGLRLVTYSTLHPSPILSPQVLSLVAFPSACSSAIICKSAGGPVPTGLPPFRYLLLTLSAVAKEKSMGVVDMSTFEIIYDQALRLWLIDRAKEKEADMAASSLYRHKNLDYNDVGEAEMEEREFLELFPSFDNVFNQEADNPTKKPMQSATLVPLSEMGQLVSLHQKLFGTQRLTGDSTGFEESRRSIVASVLASSPLPEILDDESLAFQFNVLNDRVISMEIIPETGGKSYNFYVDSNVVQSERAAVVIFALRNRLDEIIQEWPDQMVLQHLRSRCDIVLDLDLHSPVAKVLSALEQLLLQSEDWEMYANRENTLKSYQQALIGLIVEWRRLELSCWQGLLESQSKTFAEGANEWWFRLYESTIRGPLDSCKREDDPNCVEQYLQTLIPLLDDYIRTSPLGEFDARMRLLQTFESYIFHLCLEKDSDQRHILDRIHRVLRSTRSYFDLFSGQISERLAAQRGTLEKEIRNFIKLASWKDINVQALKASAQRTHHQLYKIIRKFRDVLRQPISEQLYPQPADASESKQLYIESIPPSSTPSLPSPKGTLSLGSSEIELPKALKKFENFITEHLQPFIRSRSAHVVDNLAVDIIVGAKELAALSVPSNVTAEKRQKQQKALLVRKRKALSDLLKELKRAGLAVNVKPDVLRQNADPLWLREQPSMSGAQELSMSTKKGEDYFNRLLGLLPGLRSSTSNHHSDLTTRELQRGIMFLESGFSMGITLRSQLATALEQFDKLERTTRRLQMISSSSQTIRTGTNLVLHIDCTKNVLSRLSDAIQEISKGLQTYDSFQPKNKVPEELHHEVKAAGQWIEQLLHRVSMVSDNVKLTTLNVLLADEYNALFEAQAHITDISKTFQGWALRYSRLRYLFDPVNEWVTSQEIPSLESIPAALSISRDSSDTVINSFLVTVQSMIAKYPESISKSNEENDHHYLAKDHRIVRDFTQSLNIVTVVAGLNDVLLSLVVYPDSRNEILQRIMPFLDLYQRLVKDQLATHNQWTKAVFKLNYVLCSVLVTLSKQGFCQPPETEDDGEGEDGDTKGSVGGVGLGEGSGTENVSKEIEEESQVEGLQGDDVQEERDKAKGDDKDKGDDDALEMNEDFVGDMEDVPDTESRDGSESDDEGGAEPDEQLGDLDPSDPSAVDQKMWGDEKGPEDGRQDDKINQDRSEGQSRESDVVAKEREKENEETGKKKEDATKENLPSTEDDPMPEDGEGGEEEEIESRDGGAPMDPHLQDANTLELPDDMDIGEEMDLGGDDLPEMGDDEAADDKIDNQEDQQGSENVPTEKLEEKDQPSDDQTESMDQEPGIPDQPLEVETDDGNEEAHSDKEGEKDEAVARPDVTAGDGMASSEEKQNPGGGESTEVGQKGSAQDSGYEDAPADSEAKNDTSLRQADQMPADSRSSDSLAAGQASSGMEEGQMPCQPEIKSSTNPLRSLGDALKEIQQRFDDIIAGEQRDVPRERISDVNVPSQVEYLQPDDADHDMEALGPAGEEQAAKLSDLKLIDTDEQVTEFTPMDIDPPLEPDIQTRAEESRPHGEPTAHEQQNNVEGAILRNARPIPEELVLSSDMSVREAGVDDVEDMIDEAVEVELRAWQTAGFPDAGSEKVWRLYESLTHDLAYALCEQLRLILEPTLATRLKGDYRTGKRLNMKKIISYIASDYTKDKIWLRRTRPSQREYQVLISIDDSRSMAESHSIHLAYQTLALVSKALSRLEAGDIAIAKFGETVDIIHGFSEGPFTDQSGIKVMNAFHFNQKATNVLSLVETSLKVLENARERRTMSSATAADLWQLQFIISDGMCQDHERLRTVLRKAEEQRVMIVFLIIDSLHGTVDNAAERKGAQSGLSSILTMDKAEFKNIDGRMELELKKYLDSFPFEYYVVLRNVEALPEVLSSTLKQFFERVSEE